jgi:hypothetical protein
MCIIRAGGRRMSEKSGGEYQCVPESGSMVYSEQEEAGGQSKPEGCTWITRQ